MLFSSISKSHLDVLTKRTGLKRSTVKDLLDAGWTYKETLDQHPKWQKEDSSADSVAENIDGSNWRRYVFDTEEEAKETLRDLVHILNKNDRVLACDFDRLVDRMHTEKAHHWGWKSFEGAKIRKVESGWELKLPEVEFFFDTL